MPPAGFKPTFPASERKQTFALDHSAIEIGTQMIYAIKKVTGIDKEEESVVEPGENVSK
jgi:hypothetical protein